MFSGPVSFATSLFWAKTASIKWLAIAAMGVSSLQLLFSLLLAGVQFCAAFLS